MDRVIVNKETELCCILGQELPFHDSLTSGYLAQRQGTMDDFTHMHYQRNYQQLIFLSKLITVACCNYRVAQVPIILFKHVVLILTFSCFSSPTSPHNQL